MIKNRTDVYNIANKMNLNIVHFAKGIYPQADGRYWKMPFNRFLVPVADSGSTRSYIRDGENNFYLELGNIYFIPLYHLAAVYLTENMHFISIQFTLEIFKNSDVFSRVGESKCFHEPEFIERIKQAFEYKNIYIAAAALRSVTFEFAMKILSVMTGSQLETVMDFADFDNIIRYIDTNCTAQTTVAQLADMYGSGRENFSRKFSDFFGMPPKQYLNNALLNRAVQMMLKTPLLSKEIAAELGFSNEFYFSRFFKKNMGLSPRTFKHVHFPE